MNVEFDPLDPFEQPWTHRRPTKAELRGAFENLEEQVLAQLDEIEGFGAELRALRDAHAEDLVNQRRSLEAEHDEAMEEMRLSFIKRRDEERAHHRYQEKLGNAISFVLGIAVVAAVVGAMGTPVA
jgi:hypothetical protein